MANTPRRIVTPKTKPKKRPALTEAQKKAMAKGREKKAADRAKAEAKAEAKRRKEELTTIDQRIAKAGREYDEALRRAVRASKSDEIKRLFDIADRRQVTLINLLGRQRQLGEPS